MLVAVCLAFPRRDYFSVYFIYFIGVPEFGTVVSHFCTVKQKTSSKWKNRLLK